MLDLAKLKKLLGIKQEDTSKDDSLKFTLDDVHEAILNYCNQSELPKGLENTAYRMAIDLYRNEAPGEADTPLGPVSSIAEGDTSTSFRVRADEGYKDSLLKNYKARLNRYRRLSW